MSNLDGPCPRCGAQECKRWKLLNGADVCDECWLDTAQDMLSSGGWKMAADRLVRRPPTSTGRAQYARPMAKPASPSKPRQAYPVREAQPRRDWRAIAEKLLTPQLNSICLLCSHIFYGASLPSCTRCGGLCVQRSDHDLGLMCRRATQLVEAER